MGIDYTSLEAILMSLLQTKNKNRALTLARQQIHFQPRNVNAKFLDYCEDMFKSFGFITTESIDYSSYENATIIHNMNLPYLENNTKYDFIYDGGTIEHIFNIPQVLENIINLLAIDGIFCSVTVNNNLSGHGFYQFSPELFLSCFNPNYGMEIICIYLAKVGTSVNEWIKISHLDKNNNRITAKFNDDKEVYIITIAKKISNDRLSLITNPPNQYSYEKVDWLKP
jgi:hypothetical protein